MKFWIFYGVKGNVFEYIFFFKLIMWNSFLGFE